MENKKTTKKRQRQRTQEASAFFDNNKGEKVR